MVKEETVIYVKNLCKEFILPHAKTNSIKGAFLGILNRDSKSYEVQQALEDISFEVKKGEFFGIVGRNGSGKSTLLKLLAEIYQPTKGSISTKGKIVPFIELGVGFNGELTGRENIYLNGALLGYSEKEISARYSDIVNFAELERFMDQKLKNYSSGMQVRLAFSIATRLSESDILLIDEVLAVGDASFQRKCFNYFKELKKNKKTVVFVTHDMNAVREYCDRAILIDQSRLVEDGDPALVATAYSKMFSDESMGLTTQEQGARWGNRKLQYDSVNVEVDKKNDNVVVSASYVVNKDIQQPILGFSVRNATGTVLLGTNTLIKNLKLGDLHAGQKGEVKWHVPNVFGDGLYYVNLAAVMNDGVTACDWWDDCASFEVRKAERTPYVIGPKINVKISQV